MAKTRLRKRARRDVRTAYQPALNQIDRALGTAKSDYEFADAQIENIYANLQNILEPQGRRYENAASGVMDDYQKAISDFGSTFSDSFAPAQAIGGDVGEAAAEAAKAAANAYGTVGIGGTQLLADARNRNANYFGRMGNVAGLSAKDTQLNALKQYQDLVEDLRNRKLDLRGEIPGQIMTRLDELRQQRFDNRLANRQFKLNKEQIESQEELADYLIGHIGSEAERRRNRGGRGGGGGGGKGGGGNAGATAGNAGNPSGINAGENKTGGNDGRNGRVTRIDRLNNQIDRLTGNDTSQDAAIFNIFEEQQGYPVSSTAEIKMQGGDVYVKQSANAPWVKLEDDRAAAIRRRHNQEARKVERKRGKIQKIRRRQNSGRTIARPFG